MLSCVDIQTQAVKIGEPKKQTMDMNTTPVYIFDYDLKWEYLKLPGSVHNFKPCIFDLRFL